MTEEQIKERASKFATTPREYEAYIAGANCREEDIKELANDCRARLNNYENQLCEARDDIQKMREEVRAAERAISFWKELDLVVYEEMRTYMGPIRRWIWDWREKYSKILVRVSNKYYPKK